MRRRRVGVLLVAALLAAGCATNRRSPAPKSGTAEPRAGRTVSDVLATIGPAAEKRLRSRFAAAGVPYPPTRAWLLAFKAEKRIEVWAAGGGPARKVAALPLLGESGTLGPKLREGDYQIPEGIYRVTWLHPNSQYHLSMKLDYPNAFDREQAAREGRTNLGGEIFIHGSDVSIGCLAVGDPAIEELFVLAARIGIADVTTIVAPWDLRHKAPPRLGARQPPWVPHLYADLKRALAPFR
jgi:hypothetical protein